MVKIYFAHTLEIYTIKHTQTFSSTSQIFRWRVPAPDLLDPLNQNLIELLYIQV
jgi:hypothetical protein